MNLKLAYDHAVNHGGCTYSLNFGQLPKGAPVYVIAKVGFERTCSVASFTLEFFGDYVKDHADQLVNENAYVGVWIDDGQVYLDICDVWEKEEWQVDGIREIGRLREQISVWDNEEEKVIECWNVYVYTERWAHVVKVKANGIETEIEGFRRYIPESYGSHLRIETDPAWRASERLDEFIRNLDADTCWNLTKQGNLEVNKYCIRHAGFSRYYFTRLECWEKLRIELLNKVVGRMNK